MPELREDAAREQAQTLVDHILPRRWFADPSEADDPANLISRCGSCHGKKTARAERKLLRGDIIAFQQHLKELNTYVNGP